jgi:transcription antitermination protein NusB
VRRSEQRRAAIWALYQADLLDKSLDETFPRDTLKFTKVLATEVRDHQPELDEVIGKYATGWTLGRIAPLERSILRVALLEMLHADLLPGDQAIPAAGAIDEAVETAKEFCGADAPSFVNGLLGAVLKDMQQQGATAS